MSRRRRGWSVKTLKSYTDQRFADSDKAVLAALQSAEKRVDEAASSSEKRFDQLSDQIDKIETIVQQNVGGVTTSQRLWAVAIPSILSVAAIVILLARSKA